MEGASKIEGASYILKVRIMRTTILGSNVTPPYNGLNIRIPIIIPIQGRRFMNQRSMFEGSHVLYAVTCHAQSKQRVLAKHQSRVSGFGFRA